LASGHAGEAEVYALRVRAQRQGLGRGFTSLGLWVLQENAGGRTFYAGPSGRPGSERREIDMGHTIIETA
jgi:hypothetical protein